MLNETSGAGDELFYKYGKREGMRGRRRLMLLTLSILEIGSLGGFYGI